LLIVGTYRNDEVHDDHILETSLKEMMESKASVTKVLLGCLSESSVSELVAAATDLPQEETTPLSNVIYRKTLGNCFFVRQFLEMLQDHGSLSYSFQSYKWVWQIDDINARTNISTNVVDLVMGRITMLDVTTQQIFKVFGCLGSQCPVHVLHLLSSTLVKANMDPVDETVTRQIVDKLISMNLVEACKND
jgi:predicted ATPase